MTKIYRNDLIYGIAYALDSVEREVALVTPGHSKRVACIVASMGRQLGYTHEERMDLAVCAALHDNALSEYLHHKQQQGQRVSPEAISADLGLHCTMGERNLAILPFHNNVRGAILYHHENADGSGPFGKTAAETPIFAQLIHLADMLDAAFNLSQMTEAKHKQILQFVREHTDTLFDAMPARAFLTCFEKETDLHLPTAQLDARLRAELPELCAAYTPSELMQLAGIFSKIIDYKSPFTSRHSRGIAEKARRMGAYYGWDADTQAQLYLAGAVHDVGKLMVSSDVLEKPDKLTDAEYEHIRDHAYGSYVALHNIRGFEEIGKWAYHHHEKLDGAGYPFGKTAQELGHKERLMACLDVYQALREDRPYKPGFSHEKSLSFLSSMAAQGKLDAQIVADIDLCFAPSYETIDIARHKRSVSSAPPHTISI